MRSLIITVAGKSIRFNKDTKHDVLKCLYYEDVPQKTLIYQQLSKVAPYVDEIIIVGGYKFTELCEFADKELKPFKGKIKIAYNEHFDDYGSGYSLIKGIEQLSESTSEAIFIEGDLFFDQESIAKLITSKNNVITYTNYPVRSNKSVAFYIDTLNHVNYIYDTKHSDLFIPVPFKAVYDSGQMWKFTDAGKVKSIVPQLTQKQKEGTNLEVIQRYFGILNETQYEMLNIKQWYNCNTVEDYREAVKNLEQR